MNRHECFAELCYKGLYEEARKFYEEIGDSIEVEYENIFIFAAMHGHFKLIKWIYSLETALCNVHFDKKRALMKACENDDLQIAEWIYSLGEIDLTEFKTLAFERCCVLGLLDVTKWIYSLHQDISLSRGFGFACMFGKINVAQWLYSLDPNIVDNYALYISCKQGFWAVAKWLIQLPNRSFDIHYKNEYAFRHACSNGQLDMAKLLYDSGNNHIDIHVMNENPFRLSCAKKHEDIARWLYSLGEIDIHACEEWAFIIACKEHSFSIAKWLIEISSETINIHSLDDLAFRYCCAADDIQMAKWLYGLGGVNIHAKNDQAFRLACMRGYANIARWLYSLGGINIYVKNNKNFKAVCKYRECAEWLYSLPNVYERINEHVQVLFKIACENKNPWVIEWFLSRGKIRIETLNEYADEFGKKQIVMLYSQGYHGEEKITEKLRKRFSDYVQERIKYYKLLILLIGKLNYLHNKVCEERYSYGNCGYFEAKDNFNRLTKINW
ncbi:MAG: hypothetical protein Harvfovirus48_7 [Harvfovirus sp.]|uniref:Ankyrin repeat protein n=1 Tax=Harvfovirus sp. TaxID=2487768 RepID=A0A3G5A362_9VIRU|nr:MAG: hypothetical protein Harvfovirus48_7 [Harvfovirus sp.]